jgi:DNA helicase HerA-like ATPase
VAITLPRFDKRTAVIGSTGSGKTQFAIWLLSSRDFDRRPWIIFDFKGDELIEAINPTEINVYGAPPKKPGLYVVRPIPQRDDEAVAEFLWKIWKQENTGIYVDEGFMLGTRNPALNACLTQGRSKRIEMMILSQRPVWMSKFVFSEANYYAVMNLTLEDDRKYVSSYTGGTEINLLPRYHSLWYDCDGQVGTVLKPVPGRDELLERFERRLSRKVKRI